MRKNVGFILLGVSLAVIAIGGGMWHYLEQVKQNKKEEAIEKREEKKLIEKSAREIDDFYKWNYIGVKKITTGKLWTNPASGELQLDYTVYLTNGKKTTETASWDKNDEIVPPEFSKDEKIRPEFKIPESGEYTENASDYLIRFKDIKKLKSKGYTSGITGQQIKNYLVQMYPKRFESR
ncbi:MAG TPA: hypothetical protein H9869_05965 [Candidatus Ligilactobacillus excrementipullorum]|nr:hypothetical protein [Candidatus Ligilactobacillus excrementipullorum]